MNASGFTQKACNAYAGPGGLTNKYKAQSIAKAKNICVLRIRSSQINYMMLRPTRIEIIFHRKLLQ
jgi:hypothetical protein